MNKNELENLQEIDSIDEFDFDELIENFEKQIDVDMQEIELLEKSRSNFNSTEGILEVIANSVSDQFNSRIAAIAGEDFIDDNNGLTLDLREEAHVQRENFDSGKVATHNRYVDYAKRKEENYDNRYKKDAEGKTILNRDNFDDKKMRGEGKNGKHIDHKIPIYDYANDTDELTYFDHDELKERINGKNNTKEMEGSLNLSKGAKSSTEWLDGMSDEKKRELGITPEFEKEYRDDDKRDREHKAKTLEEKKKKEEELGKQSQKEEFKDMSKHAMKAVLFGLLKNLGEELLKGLFKWFKSTQKTLKTFLGTIKTSIKNFIFNFKKNFKDVASIGFNTIMSALYGPVYRLVMSAWNLLKQGIGAIKKVYTYITAEENRNKSSEDLILGVSEIVIFAVSGASSVVLGEVIEKKLMLIPGFAIEIPVLGSIASLIGLFLGALISGILGALAINYLKKIINKKLEVDIRGKLQEKTNEILINQHKLTIVGEEKLEQKKSDVISDIKNRHSLTAKEIGDLLQNSINNLENNRVLDTVSDKMNNIKKLDNEIDDILNQLD